MTDDLFGNLPPEQPKQRQPRQKPGEPPAPAPSLASRRIYGIDAPPPPKFFQEGDVDRKCEKRARLHGNVCRIGGGDACYSDDGGRTWFCRKHRTKGFLPSDR